MKAYGIPRTYDSEYLDHAPKTSIRRSDGRSSQRSGKKRRVRRYWKQRARRAGKADLTDRMAS